VFGELKEVGAQPETHFQDALASVAVKAGHLRQPEG